MLAFSPKLVSRRHGMHRLQEFLLYFPHKYSGNWASTISKIKVLAFLTCLSECADFNTCIQMFLSEYSRSETWFETGISCSVPGEREWVQGAWCLLLSFFGLLGFLFLLCVRSRLFLVSILTRRGVFASPHQRLSCNTRWLFRINTWFALCYCSCIDLKAATNSQKYLTYPKANLGVHGLTILVKVQSIHRQFRRAEGTAFRKCFAASRVLPLTPTGGCAPLVSYHCFVFSIWQ